MQIKRRYDVAIVGAGPAGAYLAWLLAQEGLSVIILDKKEFPRYKPCGGGLTPRALALLPFDISPVVEDRAYRARVALCGRVILDRSFSDPIVTLVMRDTFDLFLIDRAQQAGAVFKPGARFLEISGSADDLTLDTSKGPLHARLIVGADGVRSRVARALRLPGGGRCMLAIESEILPHRTRTIAPYRGRVDFDFGRVPHGYGWVFPKKDHLSVGILTLSENPGSLKHHHFAYLREKGLGKQTEVKRLRGALIRCGPVRRRRFSTSRGLLIGDAAGLADPITGEGIYACFQQARVAATVIGDTFNRRIGSITRYERELRQAVQTDSVYADWMSACLYRFPRLSRAALQFKGKWLLEKFLRVAGGTEPYRHQFNPRTLAARLCRRLFTGFKPSP
jgi:geranylgeranyl reductase family protein